MRLGRGLVLSARALLAHRLRVTLAVASVAIGVASVVVTGAVGAGARGAVLKGLESMGTGFLVVRPAEVKRIVSRRAVRGLVTTLTLADAEAIASLSPSLAVAPTADARAVVKGRGTSMVTMLLGTSPAYPAVRRFGVASGRFLDDDDDRAARRVAVLGARVAASLFGAEDPVGEELRVRGVPYEVIGVLSPRGAGISGADEDGQVVIPIRTALRRVVNATWLSGVSVGTPEPDAMDGVERDIRELLRDRHRLTERGRPDDFAIQNQRRVLRLQRETARSLALATLGLCAAALLVGGAGILALMLLSVKERTPEIGLRLAVGARPRDVLVQFLAESVLLTLSGWASGIVLGGIAAWAVAATTGWSVAVPALAVLASLGMALAAGLGFGAVPAWTASRVPPIRALGSTG